MEPDGGKRCESYVKEEQPHRARALRVPSVIGFVVRGAKVLFAVRGAALAVVLSIAAITAFLLLTGTNVLVAIGGGVATLAMWLGVGWASHLLFPRPGLWMEAGARSRVLGEWGMLQPGRDEAPAVEGEGEASRG